jgi:hypothetical protein
MNLALFGLSALFLLGGHKEDSKAAPDPNQAVAKAHGGKVWVASSPIPEASGSELESWLAGHHAAGELPRKGKDGAWPLQFVAVFKKPAAKGAVIAQFSDKKEPGNVIDIFQLVTDEPTLVFHSSGELDPDRGFNTGHTYLIRVGQILNKKFVPYASGELVLK